EAPRDRRENLIPRLTLLHLPAQALPPPIPGHIRRERLRHATDLVSPGMLCQDQKGVRERSRPEPCRERDRPRPVIAGNELLDSAGQALMQLIELRLSYGLGLLPCPHHRRCLLPLP